MWPPDSKYAEYWGVASATRVALNDEIVRREHGVFVALPYLWSCYRRSGPDQVGDVLG